VRPTEITPADIAALLKLSESKLWEFARNVEIGFRPRRMQLVGTKHRPIDPMYKWAKAYFRKLHRFIQKARLAHPRAHGGVWKRSCFTSAGQHLGHRFTWTRDVKDCFPSINRTAFADEMGALGFRSDMAEFLGLFCTPRGGIPQGSPLSNDALNLYLWRTDQAISSFCGQARLAYSRIADDLVISGNARDAGDDAIMRIEGLLQDRGLCINAKKRRESGFQFGEKKNLVHNICTHNKRGTQICDEHYVEAIELAEKYRAACKSVQRESLAALADKRQRLVGWLHYCRQAHYSPAQHVRRMLEVGDRAVLKKLRSLGISAHKNKWWLVSPRRNEPKRLVGLWSRTLSRCGRDRVTA
jgi:Reverse transcriptase (RNA-dependent DNA polymerase)